MILRCGTLPSVSALLLTVMINAHRTRADGNSQPTWRGRWAQSPDDTTPNQYSNPIPINVCPDPVPAVTSITTETTSVTSVSTETTSIVTTSTETTTATSTIATTVIITVTASSTSCPFVPPIVSISSSSGGGIDPTTISIIPSSTISLPSGSFSASSVGSTTSISLPSASPSSTPSCIAVPKGPNVQDVSQPNFTFEQLYKLQTTFLDNFMYPANAIQAKMINSTLFAENVKGRVDVTRTFDGPELNTEYIFGLFATLSLNPQAVSLLGYPINYTITHFAANQNIASASVIVTFNFASLGVVVPVEVDIWNLFDTDGKILQYDATFRWFQYLYDFLFQAVAPKINATSAAQVTGYFTRVLAQGICTTHQTYCNGTNQQYADFNTCADFITNKIRFGSAYELGANTVLCRMVHENMIPFRPDVHCPHIGPSGGGMCVDDYSYISKVLQPYFTNAPFVPYGYQNSNATIAAQ